MQATPILDKTERCHNYLVRISNIVDATKKVGNKAEATLTMEISNFVREAFNNLAHKEINNNSDSSIRRQIATFEFSLPKLTKPSQGTSSVEKTVSREEMERESLDSNTTPSTTSLLEEYSTYLKKLTDMAAILKGRASTQAKTELTNELLELTSRISGAVSAALRTYLNPKPSTNLPTEDVLPQIVQFKKDIQNLKRKIKNNRSAPAEGDDSTKNSCSKEGLQSLEVDHWGKKALIIVGVAFVVLGLIAILAGLSVIPGAGPFLAALFGGSAATAAWGLFGAGVSVSIIGTAMAIGAGIAVHRTAQKETAADAPDESIVLDLKNVKTELENKFPSKTNAFLIFIQSKLDDPKFLNRFKKNPRNFLRDWENTPRINCVERECINFFEDYLNRYHPKKVSPGEETEE